MNSEMKTADEFGLRVKTPDEVRTILVELRRGLKPLYGDRLRELYLFGSYARGEAEAGSDLDVLAVLDRIDSRWDETERTSHAVASLSLEYEVTVSLVQISEADWESGDTPFLRNTRHEGRVA